MYEIRRFYAPHLERTYDVIKRVETLEEAQAHCNDESTHESWTWFDGYTEIGGEE